MPENRHAKFAAYWVSLGKPPLEIKDEDAPDASFNFLDELPYWTDSIDYRIAGDRHWALRRAWIESDFKLRIEYNGSQVGEKWVGVEKTPKWLPDVEYRAAPKQDILEELTTGYPGKVIHVVETQAFTGEGATVSVGIDLAELGSDTTVFTEGKADPGAHYRYTYRVRLTEADKANGYVDVKLDPARICKVYGISDMPHQFVIKKGLCPGKRGHKTFQQDIDDIHSALDRWVEMLKEDGAL